ncbi:hypothetical protein [Salisediminibacterium halotolerans]|uniref:hypothetical protein n=1 Tax=Salisediminibacterium halotolerans TaxID=517425 RepID=UPI000EB4CEBE|nr:hypothetical protein [Salisediminibacterium halotolerans]RLJ71662.1 hypothetical protein BCL39_2333 [Actinophytocola xinjiangensis]RPE86812.1 hypothetical protein EDD67_1674 [Salisediminibacterium halotolerans]TWG32875.1 hypothetical protein BCL52_2328 [Salisediminibacterium halotolerans]GEL06967.1 hypothetical protein SHA02_03830 [Salisediminibacterium halotolerans]
MNLIPKCTSFCEKLCCDSNFCARLGAVYYERIIEREISSIKIDPHSKVLCVGGGRTPYTACLLAEKTGADVKVIDHDSSVIQDADKFIASWNLKQGSVVCEHCCGLEINEQNFAAAHIAMQVTSQEEVLKHMLMNCACPAVLCRMPKEKVKAHYPDSLSDSVKEAAHDKVTHANVSMIGETCIFTDFHLTAVDG